MIMKRQTFIDALTSEDIELVTGMLDAGFDPNAMLHDFDDLRPIHVAAGGSSPEILELLIARGADPAYIEDRGGHTALHNASQAGKTENVAILLQHNVPLDIQGNSLLTPLHQAAANGHTEICRMLVMHGARTELKDIAELTPAEYARKFNHHAAEDAIMAAISQRNSQRIKAARKLRRTAPRPQVA